MRRTSLLLALCLLMFGSLHAAMADESADEKAVRAAAEAYNKAMNAGDLKAILSFWAEDADYVSDTGERVQGRAALEKLFARHLPALKGKKIDFEVKAMRELAPGVIIEDGVASIGDGEYQSPATRYATVWTRSNDKWRISSVRDLGVEAAVAGESPLKQLDWLLGDWTATVDGAKVELTCLRGLDGKFLIQKYRVTAGDKVDFAVTAIIGWDPVRGQLRSWFFDSRGGFGNGLWTRDGNRWTIASSGVLADGRLASATHAWNYENEDTAIWTTSDRQLEGVPMPGSEVKFVRSVVAAQASLEQ